MMWGARIFCPAVPGPDPTGAHGVPGAGTLSFPGEACWAGGLGGGSLPPPAGSILPVPPLGKQVVPWGFPSFVCSSQIAHGLPSLCYYPILQMGKLRLKEAGDFPKCTHLSQGHVTVPVHFLITIQGDSVARPRHFPDGNTDAHELVPRPTWHLAMGRSGGSSVLHFGPFVFPICNPPGLQVHA